MDTLGAVFKDTATVTNDFDDTGSAVKIANNGRISRSAVAGAKRTRITNMDT